MYTEKELWKIYQDYTVAVSNIARQLAFGAAAICWIFKESDANFPALILYSLSFIVLFFFFDGLQYYLAAIKRRETLYSEQKKIANQLPEAKRLIHTKKMKKGEELLEWPDNYDDNTYRIWKLKFCFLAISYIFIILEFLEKFHLFNLVCNIIHNIS